MGRLLEGSKLEAEVARTVGRKANDIDRLGVAAQCRQEFDRDLGPSRIDAPNLSVEAEQVIAR